VQRILILFVSSCYFLSVFYIFLLMSFDNSCKEITASQMTTNTDMLFVVVTILSFFPCSKLITGFFTRVTWQVPLLKLINLLKQRVHPCFFYRVYVPQTLVLWIIVWPLYCLSFFHLWILITTMCIFKLFWQGKVRHCFHKVDSY
jgi:hypothetical protein